MCVCACVRFTIYVYIYIPKKTIPIQAYPSVLNFSTESYSREICDISHICCADKFDFLTPILEHI